jgi:hypothetical protein
MVGRRCSPGRRRVPGRYASAVREKPHGAMTSDEPEFTAPVAAPEAAAYAELLLGYDIRPLAVDDAAALADAYIRNREHLAPWEPRRRPEFFTETAQRADAEAKLAAAAAGQQDPWVIWSGGEVVGRLNLTNIVRGVFQNASLGLLGRPPPHRPRCPHGCRQVRCPARQWPRLAPAGGRHPCGQGTFPGRAPPLWVHRVRPRPAVPVRVQDTGGHQRTCLHAGGHLRPRARQSTQTTRSHDRAGSSAEHAISVSGSARKMPCAVDSVLS